MIRGKYIDGSEFKLTFKSDGVTLKTKSEEVEMFFANYSKNQKDYANERWEYVTLKSSERLVTLALINTPEVELLELNTSYKFVPDYPEEDLEYHPA